MAEVVPKLKVSRLGKRFGELDALRDIDLTVGRGEFISVAGPSGCGKTTFLRIIAGLEPATSGEVLLDGRVVREPAADRGFVFQNDSLLPWRTVFDNAIIGREVSSGVGPAERRQTMELLKLVGLRGLRALLSRASSPAACASVSIWRGRWRSIPKFC